MAHCESIFADIKFRYEQLQALAFGDAYEPEEFEDPSLPPYDVIHKRAGPLLVKWKEALEEDPSADKVTVTATTASKRKAAASGAVSPISIFFYPCSRNVSDFLLIQQGDIDEKEIRSREAAGTLEKLTNDVLKVCALTSHFLDSPLTQCLCVGVLQKQGVACEREEGRLDGADPAVD